MKSVKWLNRAGTTVAKESTKQALKKTGEIGSRSLVTKQGVAEVAKQGARKRFVPDPNATGAHTVFRRDHITGEISKYQTYRPQTNFRNPSGWESVKRYDGHQINEVHFNKVLQRQIRTPHVHDPLTPGGIRPAELWEIPG